jgi:hypothetical protein
MLRKSGSGINEHVLRLNCRRKSAVTPSVPGVPLPRASTFPTAHRFYIPHIQPSSIHSFVLSCPWTSRVRPWPIAAVATGSNRSEADTNYYPQTSFQSLRRLGVHRRATDSSTHSSRGKSVPGLLLTDFLQTERRSPPLCEGKNPRGPSNYWDRPSSTRRYIQGRGFPMEYPIPTTSGPVLNPYRRYRIGRNTNSQRMNTMKSCRHSPASWCSSCTRQSGG